MDWRHDARCRSDIDPEWFFQEGTSQEVLAIQDEVLKFCHGCPVEVECLAAAMKEEHRLYGPVFGIRGGTLAELRHELRTNNRRAERKTP